jgi:hypothetical protein
MAVVAAWLALLAEVTALLEELAAAVSVDPA